VTLGKRPPVGERRFEQFGPVTTQTETLPAPSDQPTPPTNPKPPLAGDPAPIGPAVPGPAATNPKPGGPTVTKPRPNSPIGVPSLGGPRPVPRPGAAELPRIDAPRKALLGLRTVAVPEEIRQRLRLAGSGGALVVARTSGSAADKAGIPVESVIIEFNGAPVESPQELSRLVSEAGPRAEVEIVFIANGETQRSKVSLDEPPGAATSPRVTVPAPLVPPPPSEISQPPNKVTAPQPAQDRSEIETLKRRVQELEQRVRDLEQSAKK
jgi:membrane-associated protease RseP (regulator of RpoE activity)